MPSRHADQQQARDKGQQRVTVEHVHVHKGGQAIVGNVSPGGGVSSKLEEQPVAPALTHEPGQTLPTEIETVREAVPSADVGAGLSAGCTVPAGAHPRATKTLSGTASVSSISGGRDCSRHDPANRLALAGHSTDRFG